MRAQDAIGFGAFPVPASEPQRLWGRDLIELHDHFWRQAGVTVVRPGYPVESSTGTARRRTRAYLLLGLDELAAFSPGDAMRRLNAGRARSILVQLESALTPAYSERIDSDDRDALVAVRRDYGTAATTPSVLMTRDERLAGWWRRWVHPARHPRAASAVDRVLARRRRPLHGSAPGVLQDATDAHGCGSWIESMLRLDASLAETVPGVRERELGVWVHESARIGPHVSLAGPLWIGEHVVLDGNTSLVGPQLIADEAAPMPNHGGKRSARANRDELPEWAQRPELEAFPAPASIETSDRQNAAPPAVPSAVRTAERILARLRGRRLERAGQSAAGSRPAIQPLVPAVERIVTEQRMIPREPWTVRAFNIAVSFTVLAAILPLFPLIMAAIWLEDGRPFFFGHVRQTRGGRNFTCWKFRTMCRDAERMKTQLALENVCDGPQFHIVDDPRLLRIGRLLRRFHLDELPQLWNVLRGDMNLVGPRPSPHDENQYCPAWREARLSVKPGLTGLWQIRRTRAPMADFQEWIRWDLEYVTRRSWRLDLWIIFRTAMDIIRRDASEAAPVSQIAGDPMATMTGFAPPRERRLPVTSVTTLELKSSGHASERSVDGAILPSTSPHPTDAELIRDAIDAVIDGGAATARRFEDLEPMVYDDDPAAAADASEVESSIPRSAATRLEAIGLEGPEVDADANAAAVRRAAARSRAEAMARTTLIDEQELRAGTEIRQRIDAEIARGAVPAAGPDPSDTPATSTSTDETTSDAASGSPNAPGIEAEAKPRQPESTPGALGAAASEAKPSAAGEGIADDVSQSAMDAIAEPRPTPTPAPTPTPTPAASQDDPSDRKAA
ncbi:MAG: sugar transferase [Phycisphaerales bacterium]